MTDLRHIACIQANVFHETGGRMVPVRETFASSDREAIANLDRAWKAGKLGSVAKPYWREGWFGRGPLQITHRENYEKVGRALGLDLVAAPHLLLDIKIGARSAVVGMKLGLFAADKKGPQTLDRYFAANVVTDPVASRAIVNGRDKAKLVATYYEAFLAALKAAAADQPQPADVRAEAALPDDVKPVDSGLIQAAGGLFGSGVLGLSFLGNIDNGFALGAFALLVAAAGAVAWALMTGRLTINRRAGAA
ncbi:glycoside hydrolase family 19 protein [Chelatococcus asaccharovorans]|uniref:glycoside hydrolase family 19 protein n=1 Tax=Chelatococcus asaccharovorans TaxID=28210 RepID=UPI001FDF526F|nr:glycoside hydrolase family 19 protein [Chelatococcus asaccharovorans]